MVNVLVTGTGGGAGQSIIKALKICQLPTNIITTDAHLLAAGLYRGNKGYLVPLAYSPRFAEVVIEICNKEAIDVILVGSDPELAAFATNKEQIEKLSSAKVVVSSPRVVEITRDKWKTYLFLKETGFPCPRSALPDHMWDLIDEVGFPVVIKPRFGSASTDVYTVNKPEELELFAKRVNDPVIQECVGSEMEEYTSGFVMINDQILGVITAKRELKAGMSYRVLVDHYENVKAMVLSIAAALRPFGPCNVQMRVVRNIPVTFEINARFSGTTGIRAALGFNEVESVLRSVLFGEQQLLSYKRGIAMRYWNEVYLSFEKYAELQSKQVIKNSNSWIMDYL